MEEWGGTGDRLPSVHDSSLLVAGVCSLCCRGLAWSLRGGVEKYLLLIGLKKQVRSASRAVALGLM